MLKTFVSRFMNVDLFKDIMRVAIYPAEFNDTDQIKVVQHVTKFLQHCGKNAQKIGLPNFKQLKTQSDALISILTIRDSKAVIINYDNVEQHIDCRDLSIKELIRMTKEHRIENIDEFKSITNNVLDIIRSYYEVTTIQSNIEMYDLLIEKSTAMDLSPFEFLARYKDSTIQLYNDLSKLKTVSKQEKKLTNFFIVDTEDSVKTMSESIFSYLTSDYSFYKTGYDLFDRYIKGFESASLHIISAASNHGKSLLMINLCERIINNNIDEFEKGDAILFVTLEDDIRKLTRRFASIFGNYINNDVKKLYEEIYSALKDNPHDKVLKKKAREALTNVYMNSIYRRTQGKVTLIPFHGEENTFTPGDLSTFIDTQKVNGYNIKIVFLDYIDVMQPSVYSPNLNGNDYIVHGQIVHELRGIARRHNIPIITATQNSRSGEDETRALNNAMIGDSYRKIRYADFIYMGKMHFSKSILDKAVKKFVIDSPTFQSQQPANFDLLKVQNKLMDVLIPYEIKITKSKDDGRDQYAYFLFCKENLKIYQNIFEYLADYKEIQKNTLDLRNEIDGLFNNNSQASSIDIFDTILQNSNQELEEEFIDY